MEHIIIATDSRGKGLDTFISTNNSLPYHSTVLILPGATLQRIDQSIRDLLNNQYPPTHLYYKTHIYISAGICNITTKSQHEHGTEITYSREDQITNITDILQKMYTYYTSLDNTTFHIITIPPINLQKCIAHYKAKQSLTQSAFTLQQIEEKQQQLEADIRNINTNISQLNTKYKHCTIRWDRDIMRHSTKKRGKRTHKIHKFTYVHLTDGVHASDCLKSKWFTVLCRSIKDETFNSIKFSDADGDCDENDDDDDDDTNNDHWDFKRQKHLHQNTI